MSAQALSADSMIGELIQTRAPSVGKLSYSHEALIDLIVANPWMDQNALAAKFGYTPGWISRIIGSDAFQAKLASRREEIVDPAIKATIEERFRALVVLSLERLHEELAKPAVNPQVALKAAELGAKALGLGGHAPQQSAPPEDRLARLAERLLILQSDVKQRGVTYEGQVVEEGKSTAGGPLPQTGERTRLSSDPADLILADTPALQASVRGA